MVLIETCRIRLCKVALICVCHGTGPSDEATSMVEPPGRVRKSRRLADSQVKSLIPTRKPVFVQANVRSKVVCGLRKMPYLGEGHLASRIRLLDYPQLNLSHCDEAFAKRERALSTFLPMLPSQHSQWNQ